jgi:hypothetical protein
MTPRLFVRKPAKADVAAVYRFPYVIYFVTCLATHQ